MKQAVVHLAEQVKLGSGRNQLGSISRRLLRTRFGITPPHTQAQRNQQRRVHSRQFRLGAVSAEVTEPLGIDTMYLLAQRRGNSRGTPDGNMRGQGVLGRGGEIHDLNHGAVLVALIIRHDDGWSTTQLFRANGVDVIDIVYVTSGKAL